MAAELTFLSTTQIQKLSQYQNRNQIQHPAVNPDHSLASPYSNFHMWNSREIHQEDDDSWEVRAFAEDTNVMGSTWPPRLYRCTFCRRDFRSAQALGGHMNVHRRDRARLQQPQPSSSVISSSPSNSSRLTRTQDFFPNSGLCSFPQKPKASNSTFTPTAPRAMIDSSSSKFLSILSQTKNNLLSPSPMNLPVAKTIASASSYRHCGKAQKPSAASSETGHEELDLELRLGHRRKPV